MNPRPQARECGVEQILGQGVGVFAWRQSMAEPEDRGAVHRRRQKTEDRRGGIGAGEQAFVEALLNLMLDVVTEIPYKAETLPVAGLPFLDSHCASSLIIHHSIIKRC